MSSNTNGNARRIASAALAIVFTLGVHGIWLGDLDRGTTAPTAAARAA